MRAKSRLVSAVFRAVAASAALGVAISAIPVGAQAQATPTAEQLAGQIVRTAKDAEAAARAQGLPEDQVQAAIANAVNNLVLNSGARPAVVLAALRIARRRLQIENTADTTVIAALNAVATAVASTTGAGAPGGGGGAAPLGAPPTTDSNSGSGYR